MMKYGKIAMVVTLFVYIFLLTYSTADNSKTVDQIADQVLTDDLKKSDSLKEEGDSDLKRFYSLNAKDTAGYVLYGPAGTMDVDEILIIKSNDDAQMAEIKASVESRIETQLNNFEGYGTDQTDLLNHAVVRVKGNFLLFAVGDQASELDASFSKSVRK